MKTLLAIILLSAVTCIGAVSKPYILFIIRADINPAHHRQFETKVNKVLKNVADESYSFTNVRYTNTANQVSYITVMSIAEIAPTATDADIKAIKQSILAPNATDADIKAIKQSIIPPSSAMITILPTYNPFEELQIRGLYPEQTSGVNP